MALLERKNSPSTKSYQDWDLPRPTDLQMKDLEDRLSALVLGSPYQIVQSNGQRVFCPRHHVTPPPKGTEVFVGNLPPDLFEDELVPLFSRRGTIFNVRVMLDFFGRGRGYAFVSYFRPEDARSAVTVLNGYRVRKGTRMAVCISVDNRRLFVGNVPKDRKVWDVEELLRNYVEGVVKVIMYEDPERPGMNRGFVFVEFESHRFAAIARRQLAPGNLILWGQTAFVDWAEPLPIVDPEVLKQVTKLYLFNLPAKINSDELQHILHTFLPPMHILKVHKVNDYAFVHFTIRKFAEEAFRKLRVSGLVIMGKEVGVEWARPIEYSKTYRMTNLPENFCRSVPPGMRRMVQQSILQRKHYKKNRSPKGSSGSDSVNNGSISDFNVKGY